MPSNGAGGNTALQAPHSAPIAFEEFFAVGGAQHLNSPNSFGPKCETISSREGAESPKSRYAAQIAAITKFLRLAESPVEVEYKSVFHCRYIAVWGAVLKKKCFPIAVCAANPVLGALKAKALPTVVEFCVVVAGLVFCRFLWGVGRLFLFFGSVRGLPCARFGSGFFALGSFDGRLLGVFRLFGFSI